MPLKSHQQMHVSVLPKSGVFNQVWHSVPFPMINHVGILHRIPDQTKTRLMAATGCATGPRFAEVALRLPGSLCPSRAAASSGAGALRGGAGIGEREAGSRLE